MLGRDDLIAAARKLWGEPTQRHEDEWRFGEHQSKSIKFKDLVWFDFETGEGGGVVDLCARAGIGARPDQQTNSATITYDYKDEKNNLLFQVVRMPGHKFRQRKPDGHGGWIWNLQGVRRVLYRLPELVGASPADGVCFVCEGEKDTDNLRRLGVVATTNPGGAGKWRDDYSIFLKDWDVVVLPDNDGPGRNHASLVRRSLHGVAHSVRVLALPGLADKGDVSDWIAAGGTKAKLLELVELLPADEEEEDVGWLQQCQISKSGEPLPNFKNAILAVRSDLKLKSLYSYDRMLRQWMVAQSEPVPVIDKHISETHEYLQAAGLRRLSRETVRWAIYTVAEERPYHPLFDHLNGLQWDGTARLETWLHEYLGAEDNQYTQAIGKMFIISMVARIFQPGCKVDTMLVLEGPQGKKKSMACNVLAGDEYFTDHLPDIGQGKEVSQHLRGKWIVEISEMHAFNKAEATALKAFLSRRTERYRPPYAETEVDEPRQCVFIGTSNKDQYLRDETGGRRFWPVKCGNINIELLRQDRDQLLAEAVQEFRDGTAWWPTDAEEKLIEPEQEERYEFDEWFDRVQTWLDGVKETTITAVATGCLDFEKMDRFDVGAQRRIAAILRKCGWEMRMQSDGKRRWVKKGLF